MNKVLEVNNINKYFGKKKVLDDVSFDIKEGQILGFIGPNGAGKTTTIKLILGLQSISSGTIKINGFDVTKDFKKAIKSVGSIVENPDLYMYLSGRKNLELIANLYNNIDSKRIDEVIKLVGLENRINDKVSKYSLGMRQRLGIAAAILHNPDLLILDEPTNGLDPNGIIELRNILKKLAKEGKSILISSHNLAELDNFCTDVVIIQNGKVVSQESSKEIKNIDGYKIELDKTKGIKKLDNYEFTSIEDDYVIVNIDKEDVPKLIKDLIDNNYKIYGVYKSTLTLEEAFIKKTGGNKID